MKAVSPGEAVGSYGEGSTEGVRPSRAPGSEPRARGLALRHLSGTRLSPTFAAVTLAFTALSMLGWRAAFLWWARRGGGSSESGG